MYLEDEMPNLNTLENALPVAPLKLVVMDSAQKMGEEINSYLVEFRKNINNKFSKETGIQGFVGASSMERLPVEKPLMEATKAFKDIPINK